MGVGLFGPLLGDLFFIFFYRNNDPRNDADAGEASRPKGTITEARAAYCSTTRLTVDLA
jgi:hypothetical protein